MVLSRNKKNNIYPFKPQFYYINWGLRGSKLYRRVFVMYLLTRAPNEDSNQPAYPHRLIGVFVVCMKKLYTIGYSKYAKWKFWSDCTNMLADLNVRITKTCLYNFDPLKPHFYIVKLGFTGVYITFLISAQNIECGYSLEPPHRGGSNEYPQCMFWAELWKISEFFIRKFSFFWWLNF